VEASGAQTEPRYARVYVEDVGHAALNIALDGAATIVAKARMAAVA
jgi:hypothetical protein